MPKLLAKINLKSIKQNAEVFKRLTKNRLCAVVKADAYGHGAEKVAYALADTADFFAVSSVEEALGIQTAACGKPILVLAPPTSERETELIVQEGFRLCVVDLQTAKWAIAAAKRQKTRAIVHIKVNTGMNRYGMNVSMLGKVCKLFSGKEEICAEGLFSHLYTHDIGICERQRLLFEKMRAVCRRYFPQVLCHLSATYGSLLGDEYAYDMVRIGLGLYGYLPEGVFPTLCLSTLQKAMTIFAPVLQSRTYSFGGAGYGRPNAKPPFLSVLRAGYGDGLKRGCGSGIEAESVNDLCMDACLIAGKKKRGKKLPVLADADAVARAADTISYEILCNATRRAEIEYCYESF